MSDLPHWSMFLARVRRVQLRIHPLFIAVAVLALFLSTSQPGEEAAGYGLLAVLALFVSVLIHEAGHLLASVRMGGGNDLILVGPLGSMFPPETSREPQAELLVALAGPVANLLMVLVLLPVMLAVGIHAGELMVPWQPIALIKGAWWVVTVKLFFWCNWVQLLANLLPAYPLDGARILRALLTPAVDYRAAGAIAVRMTKLTAIGLVILAYFLRDAMAAEVLPVWVPLVLLAVLLYTSAAVEFGRQDESEWEEELFNYDFSQGYTSLERTMDPPRKPRSTMRQWIENRREMRRLKRRLQEQEEERQVDAILIRLHEVGLDGLSSKERALLHRVSARYRNRLLGS